jgi:hypothetical protein
VIAVSAVASITMPVVLPELSDATHHAIAGRSVVPAVELLELLLHTVAEHERWSAPPPMPLTMTDVAFPRFLPTADIPRARLTVRLERMGDGLRAVLVAHLELANGMKRSREHAQVTFGVVTPPVAPPPSPACDFEVAAERIYREAIPLGPRYGNLHGTIRLGRAGGTAIARSPEPLSGPPRLGGCPYLLDAAMHLACVWGQRYAGYVAYPTGFASRVLSRPTPSGERRCLVLPRSVEPRRLLCDLWLLDGSGQVCDAVTGLAMSPLASGAPPPPWLSVPEERA